MIVLTTAGFCVEPLARLEIVTALATLAGTFPDAQLADVFATRRGKYHPTLVRDAQGPSRRTPAGIRRVVHPHDPARA
jgi:hypothetical protein